MDNPFRHLIKEATEVSSFRSGHHSKNRTCQEEDKPACEITLELPVMKDTQVIIAYVTDPNNFYVIRRQDLQKLDYIKRTLCSVMTFGGLETFRPELSQVSVAAVKFNAHDSKRVKIIRSMPNRKTLVQFIDNGNTSVFDSLDLKVLPTKFENIPPLAIRCSMDILPPKQKTWSEDIIKSLKAVDFEKAACYEKLDGGGLYARCISIEKGIHIVKLKPLIGEDWGQVLVESGLARRMNAEEEELEEPTNETEEGEQHERQLEKADSDGDSDSEISDYDFKEDEDDIANPIRTVPMEVHKIGRKLHSPVPDDRASTALCDSGIPSTYLSGNKSTMPRPIETSNEFHYNQIETNFSKKFCEESSATTNSVQKAFSLFDDFSKNPKIIEIVGRHENETAHLGQEEAATAVSKTPENNNNTSPSCPTEEDSLLRLEAETANGMKNEKAASCPETCSNNHEPATSSTPNLTEPPSETGTNSASALNNNFPKTKPKKRVQPKKRKEPELILSDCDDNEDLDLDPSQDYRFTLDKLPQATSILDLNIKPNDIFFITHAFNYYHFYIISKDAKQENGIRILDEINCYVEDGLSKIKHVPRMRDLMVVKQQQRRGRRDGRRANGEEKYYRGVIQLILNYNRYEVKNIDSGKSQIVKRRDLFEMTDDLMQFPPLGYEIFLEGVLENPPLILSQHFDLFKPRLISKKLHVIKKFLSNSMPTLVMKEEGVAHGKLLSDEINSLKIWPWEETFNNGISTNDEAICNSIEPILDVPALELRVPDDITILIHRVAFVEEMEGKPLIAFEILESEVDEIKKVLAAQIKRYIDKVSASKYFPGSGDMVFLLPPAGEPFSGEWHRALKFHANTGLFYGIDNGVTYNTAGRKDYQFRRAPADFTTVPHLILDGTIHGFLKNDSSCQVLEKVFCVGREVCVTLEKASAGFFIFRCLEFEQEMKKFSVQPHGDVDC